MDQNRTGKHMWIKQLPDFWLRIINDNGEILADALDLKSAELFIKNHKQKIKLDEKDFSIFISCSM